MFMGRRYSLHLHDLFLSPAGVRSLLRNLLPSDGRMTFAVHKTQFLDLEIPALFLSS